MPPTSPPVGVHLHGPGADRDEVIGCVYLPDTTPGGAHVTSWVRVANADLDRPLHDAVTAWLASDWPFPRVTAFPRA
jgi:hypothetical protein